MARKIVLLPGDGIGPEIIEPAVRVLDAVAPGEFEYESHAFGGAAIDAHGVALTDETLAACRGADAVLLAAVGGPKYDTLPRDKRPERGLLAIRAGMGLYANLRPAILYPELAAYRISEAALDTGENPVRVFVFEVSGNYFDALRIQPYLGRFFHAADEHGPNSAPYVVLSYSYWHSRLQGDHGVVVHRGHLIARLDPCVAHHRCVAVADHYGEGDDSGADELAPNANRVRCDVAHHWSVQ